MNIIKCAINRFTKTDGKKYLSAIENVRRKDMDICPMIKEHLEKYESVMRGYSPKLARLYRNCYLHTFDAFSRREDGTLSDYLVSGDIPAMWLRDSSAQLWNYVCFANDPEIGGLIRSVIKKQFSYIAVDPYANAFNEQPSDRGHTEDIPRKSPWVWERKYELDSLSYPLRLIYKYYKVTGDGAFIEEVLPGTVKTILDVLETEQHHFEKSEYRFSRETDRYNDTLHNDGMGEPVGYTGMTWQGFRPSDDAVSYGYNIPGNIFAYVVLGYASELLKNCAPEIAERAERLRQEMLDGVRKYGITEHEKYGKIFAYETDGLGNYEFMDDANTPSLLSLPYIGFNTAGLDEVYKNTRRFILSEDNPYYYKGGFASGLGSPHEYTGYIWHMGLSMQGLTSEDAEEMRNVLDTLISADADTGYMHECFDPDDPKKFKREFFTWSDALFCEFAERCVEKKVI